MTHTMENKIPQNKPTTSAATSGAQARTAASARSRTSGAGAQTAHRPSGFAPTASQKRQAPKKPEPAKAAAKPKREKPIHNKRTQSRHRLALWQKLLLIGIALLVVFIAVIVLIFGGRGGTYHQLPRIERKGPSEFMPEATNEIDDGAALSEQPNAMEEANT